MLRAGLWMFMARVTQGVLNLGLMILVSRWLSPADRGAVGLYLMLIALVLAFSEVAAGSAVVVLLGRLQVPAAFRVYSLWSLLMTVVLVALFFFMGKIPAMHAFPLAAAALIQALLAFGMHLTLGRGKTMIYCLAILLSSLLPLLLFVITAKIFGSLSLQHWLWSMGLGWGSTGILLALGVGVLHQSWKKWLLPDPSVSVWSAMFGRGLLNQSNHLVTLTLNRLPYLLLPSVSLGVYANALSLAEAVLLLPGSLGTAIYSRVAARPEKARSELSLGFLALAMLLCAIGFFFLLSLPGSFYTALFGASYETIPQMLLRLAPGLWIYSGYLLLSYWHSGQDRFLVNLQSGLLGLGVACIYLLVIYLKQSTGLELQQLVLAQTLGWGVMTGWQLLRYRQGPRTL